MGEGEQNKALGYLKISIAEFRDSVEVGATISDEALGEQCTGRQIRVHTVYTNLMCHCFAVKLLIEQFDNSDGSDVSFLNHQSISVLGRAIIDAGLMVLYQSELSLSADEWDLRRQVLFLHDIANRKRFLTSGALSSGKEDTAFMQSYPEVRDGIKSRISDLGKNLGLKKSEIEDLRKGQTVFVKGVRGAVREAGWDLHDFETMHTYLSNFVHCHPVSYMRAQQHGISYFSPSEFQLMQSSSVLAMCASVVSQVNERMKVFLASYESDPIGQLD